MSNEGTLIEKDGKIYHTQHDFEIRFSDDNTKHFKTVTVIIRGDVQGSDTIKDAVKQAGELFQENRT